MTFVVPSIVEVLMQNEGLWIKELPTMLPLSIVCNLLAVTMNNFSSLIKTTLLIRLYERKVKEKFIATSVSVCY